MGVQHRVKLAPTRPRTHPSDIAGIQVAITASLPPYVGGDRYAVPIHTFNTTAPSAQELFSPASFGASDDAREQRSRWCQLGPTVLNSWFSEQTTYNYYYRRCPSTSSRPLRVLMSFFYYYTNIEYGTRYLRLRLGELDRTGTLDQKFKLSHHFYCSFLQGDLIQLLSQETLTREL